MKRKSRSSSTHKNSKENFQSENIYRKVPFLAQFFCFLPARLSFFVLFFCFAYLSHYIFPYNNTKENKEECLSMCTGKKGAREKNQLKFCTVTQSNTRQRKNMKTHFEVIMLISWRLWRTQRLLLHQHYFRHLIFRLSISISFFEL